MAQAEQVIGPAGDAPLDNARWEAFAWLICGGVQRWEAWQQAATQVGAQQPSRSTATHAALDAIRHPLVRARIDRIRTMQADDDRTRAMHRDEFVATMSDIVRNADAPPRDRIAAGLIVARAQGFDEPDPAGATGAGAIGPGSREFEARVAAVAAVAALRRSQDGEVIDSEP